MDNIDNNSKCTNAVCFNPCAALVHCETVTGVP